MNWATVRPTSGDHDWRAPIGALTNLPRSGQAATLGWLPWVNGVRARVARSIVNSQEAPRYWPVRTAFPVLPYASSRSSGAPIVRAEPPAGSASTTCTVRPSCALDQDRRCPSGRQAGITAKPSMTWPPPPYAAIACSAPVDTSPTVRQSSTIARHSPPGKAILVPSGDQATALSARSRLDRSPPACARGAAAGAAVPRHSAGKSATGVPPVAATLETPSRPVQPGAAKASQRPPRGQPPPPL